MKEEEEKDKEEKRKGEKYNERFKSDTKGIEKPKGSWGWPDTRRKQGKDLNQAKIGARLDTRNTQVGQVKSAENQEREEKKRKYNECLMFSIYRIALLQIKIYGSKYSDSNVS